MKRISMALSILGLSTAAFAAYPAGANLTFISAPQLPAPDYLTDPSFVTIPLLPGGFFIGGSGFYLQPSQPANALDNVAVSAGTEPSFTSSLATIDPGYDWGWGINLGYVFPNTGNDVEASYFNFNSNDVSDVSFPPPPEELVSPSFVIALINSNLRAENDINQVDLSFGQFVNVGHRLIMHGLGGLRWAQVEQERTKINHFLVTDADPRTDFFINDVNKSDFQGLGPIVGLDASYSLGGGFGLVNHFDSAVLIGTMRDTSNSNTADLTGILTITTRRAKKISVVPILDEKLGADYMYPFNDVNSSLTLELGWQFSNYFNAIEAIGGPPESATIHKTSNLALQGPYGSLVLHL